MDSSIPMVREMILAKLGGFQNKTKTHGHGKGPFREKGGIVGAGRKIRWSENNRVQN